MSLYTQEERAMIGRILSRLMAAPFRFTYRQMVEIWGFKNKMMPYRLVAEARGIRLP